MERRLRRGATSTSPGETWKLCWLSTPRTATGSSEPSSCGTRRSTSSPARPAAPCTFPHLFHDLLSIIDISTGFPTVTTVPVARGPHAVAVSGDESLLYIACNGGPPPSGAGPSVVGGLTVVLHTKRVRSAIETGGYAASVALSKDERRAYVANSDASTLSAVDITGEPRVVDEVDIDLLGNVCVNADGTRLYAGGAVSATATFSPPGRYRGIHHASIRALGWCIARHAREL